MSGFYGDVNHDACMDDVISIQVRIKKATAICTCVQVENQILIVVLLFSIFLSYSFFSCNYTLKYT